MKLIRKISRITSDKMRARTKPSFASEFSNMHVFMSLREQNIKIIIRFTMDIESSAAYVPWIFSY